MAAPNVKFPRQIKQGNRGLDVVGHKRALSRARPDLYLWADFTELAGDALMDAVVAWKKSRGLGTARVLGGRAHEVLERTHRKGHSGEWAFDQTAIKQCQAYYDKVTKSPEERVREAIVNAGFYWHSHRLNIPYDQQRPFALMKPPAVPRALDCSEFVTICHYAGGAPDPNGRHYSGDGYTGTLKQHGTKVLSIGSLKPGDLIFYGHSRARPGFNAGDPTHVGLYVGKNMSLQMGSYPMKYIDYRYRKDLHSMRTYKVA
jgi:cell wall-associated NlpC family hydrolase